MNTRLLQLAGIAALLLLMVSVISSIGGVALWWSPQPPSSTAPAFFLDDDSVRPPNVLLLIADDVGVDKVGAYADDADPDYRSSAGYLPQTPTIDSLADAGIRFTDAWANPKCSPTRAAMYTGLHGFRTGIGAPLGPPGQEDLDPDAFTTIAEVLAEEGYTSGMVGKWHLGEGDAATIEWEEDTLTETTLHPLEHGWDSFVGTLTGEVDTDGVSTYTDWERISSRGENSITNNETTYATEQTVDDGLAWVARQDGPWMLTMAFHAPHTPLEAPPEDCVWTEDEELSDDKAIYRAMLECLDINIADMLSGLDAIGQLDDTLIIFIGDNGTESDVAEDVFDDGRGKGSLHESGVRVPLIIADGRTWMQQQDNFVPTRDWLHSTAFIESPGESSGELVHAVDLFATIAEAALADGSTGEDSVSLMPILRDTGSELRDHVFSELFQSDETGEVAIRVDDWKLIARVVEEDGETCRGNYRLFDLSTDRFEDDNLKDDESDTLATMVDWLDAVGDGDAWFAVEDCD